jgi:malonyl-CoA/methylmalonyl-CoA synthetase
MTFPERFTEIVVDFPRKIILSDNKGTYTSEQVFNSARSVAADLLERRSFKGERIAVLAPPGLPYVAAMIGGWMAGAMMVPLCAEHPPAELEHVISDSGAKLVICNRSLQSQLPPLKIAVELLDADQAPKEEVPLNWDYPLPGEPALMLYTSGTTGKPKGVVHTHASFSAQIHCLITAWEWTDEDRILHFLPLHHTHGIINKLFCALWSGARCDMLPKFDAEQVWRKIAEAPFTLFMAVPTVYSKLIQSWEAADEKTKAERSDACKKLRLMVSGSAALPVSVLEKWKTISGHVLLERYGMTEIGMALSNPLHGERRPGYVGQPLPGMEVRLVDDAGEFVSEGELQVRGANVFREYWKKAAESKKSFTEDGWFKTGDMVAIEDGYYRIVGRLSTDIIKSGGYKISALEIESVLLRHPAVAESSVAGIPDETWGEKIAAAIVLKENSTLSLDELRDWAKEFLAAYKLPSLLSIQASLPRNAMGKVVKSEVKKFFFA